MNKITHITETTIGVPDVPIDHITTIRRHDEESDEGSSKRYDGGNTYKNVVFSNRMPVRSYHYDPKSNYAVLPNEQDESTVVEVYVERVLHPYELELSLNCSEQRLAAIVKALEVISEENSNVLIECAQEGLGGRIVISFSTSDPSFNGLLETIDDFGESSLGDDWDSVKKEIIRQKELMQESYEVYDIQLLQKISQRLLDTIPYLDRRKVLSAIEEHELRHVITYSPKKGLDRTYGDDDSSYVYDRTYWNLEMEYEFIEETLSILTELKGMTQGQRRDPAVATLFLLERLRTLVKHDVDNYKVSLGPSAVFVSKGASLEQYLELLDNLDLATTEYDIHPVGILIMILGKNSVDITNAERLCKVNVDSNYIRGRVSEILDDPESFIATLDDEFEAVLNHKAQLTIQDMQRRIEEIKCLS